MNKILTAFSFLFLLCFSAVGQAETEMEQIQTEEVDDDYKIILKEMFKVAGTEEAYDVVIKQMFVMFKEQYTDVEAEVWDGLEKEFSAASSDELTDMLVPVYKKYMTKEDLEEVIKFYLSPVGKKFARNTPLIMQESMQVGQQWGMKIGEEFERKMKEKGY